MLIGVNKVARRSNAMKNDMSQTATTKHGE